MVGPTHPPPAAAFSPPALSFSAPVAAADFRLLVLSLLATPDAEAALDPLTLLVELCLRSFFSPSPDPVTAFLFSAGGDPTPFATGAGPLTLSVRSTSPARRTHALRRVYRPSPPRGPIFSKWLSPYCHPSSSTDHDAKRVESVQVRPAAVGVVNEGEAIAPGELEEGAAEDVADATAEEAEPRMRERVGEGGVATAALLSGEFGETGGPAPPTGKETEATAERRTCHSGSSQRHSVVFFSRELGSDLVGEGM